MAFVSYWYDKSIPLRSDDCHESLIAMPDMDESLYNAIVSHYALHERDVFTELRKWNSSVFQFSDNPDKADILVYPRKLKDESDIHNITKHLTSFAKPTLVFLDSDSSEKWISILSRLINSPQIIGKLHFAHTSIYKSRLNEGYPNLIQHALLSSGGSYSSELCTTFSPLIEEPTPTIGFCGVFNATNHPTRHRILTEIYNYRGPFQKLFRINMIPRPEFFNGQMDLTPRYNNLINQQPQTESIKQQINHISTLLNQTVSEFSTNITSSTFTLVVRGAGNFSARFSEVMRAGRIPILIDTDTFLPYENAYPNLYRGICRVPESICHGTNWIEKQFFPFITDWCIKNPNLIELQKHNSAVAQLFKATKNLENLLHYIVHGTLLHNV